MNEELCDEEKSYHEWVANNLSFVNQNKQSISIMKKLYMEGFAAGFDYRYKLRAEEELQK
ncbi:MAG: hypothetical protein EBS93_08900 [Chitinophagia bacterium]|nr:hypothetical protein [Chitinophagia bacterium]NCA30820.1 hypothetical protein [Chitinophagia bacterium]